MQIRNTLPGGRGIEHLQLYKMIENIWNRIWICIGLILPGERRPNRTFLSLNNIQDSLRPGVASGPEGIMRKDTTTSKLTKLERERHKKISKKRYIAAPCGIRITTIKVVYSNYPNKQGKVKDIDISIPHGKKQYFGVSHLHDGHIGHGSPPP